MPPGDPVFNVLFLCTGNSARSIMAEALINDRAIGRGRFRGFSAGSHPRGSVHPLAINTLREHHIATEGLRSKSWTEFAGSHAPPMHIVITVCDAAAAEPCPIWPGAPVTAHWGVPDPAAVGGEREQRQAFRDAFAALRRRIERLADLPVATLAPKALSGQLAAIAREP